MLIYLDTCSIQRPLDTKTQARIYVEAEAILAVVALCEAGEIQLVSSEALQFEMSRTPNATRREYASTLLARAVVYVEATDEVIQRAIEISQARVAPLDSLHLASAIEGKADFFCTCDDKFLRRAKAIAGLSTKVVSPLELIEELGL
jgi:predicted nucleic acid-binding protein